MISQSYLKFNRKGRNGREGIHIFAGILFALLIAASTQAQTKQDIKRPDEPVLIVHNLCPEKGPSAKRPAEACETAITKADFDNLVAALDPKMPESNRLVLATEYVKLLVLGREAERLKLDQQAAFKQLEEFTRLQLLQRQLVRALESEASVISAQEIAQYYQEHRADFEEGSFRKVYIPKQGKPHEEEGAQAVWQRAAAGADLDQLQHEAWTAQGRPSGAPSTLTGMLRRSSLPASGQKIFDLKPQEVSPLISDVDAYYIYRMESKRIVPLDSASSAIRTQMANERLQERISRLRSAVMVSVNEDYFGALPSIGELAKHHGLEHQGPHLMPMQEAEKKPK